MKTNLNSRLNRIEKNLNIDKDNECNKRLDEEILVRMLPYDLSVPEKRRLCDYSKDNGLTWEETLQEFYPGKYTTAEEAACRRAFREQYTYPEKAGNGEELLKQLIAEVEAYSEFEKQYFDDTDERILK